MSVLTVSRTIHASPDKTWEAFADFGGVSRFHPYVDTSPLTSEFASGVGAERQCNFYDGNHVIERIVDWDEGHRMVVDIVEGSMPLATARAVITFTPGADGTTDVAFTMDYTPKWGLVGAAMDVLMMRRQFRGVLTDLLQGLDTHLQTGAIIGRGGEVQTQAA